MKARELVGLLVKLSRSGDVIVPPEKASYLKDYLECRTPAKGGRVLHCVECGTYTVAYNACNRRGCPVCSPKNQMNWQVKMKQRLLATGHHHLVFSFSERFTQDWSKHPRATIEEMMTAVRTVIRKLERKQKVRLGCILVFQSHCQGLAKKAHIHCLVTDGGLDDQGQWKSLGILPLGEMTQWLKKKLKARPEDKGWRIHESRHETGGEAVVGYLGHRLHGAVVNAKEVTQREDGQVEVRTRGGVVSLSEQEFVRRYMDHIPEKGTMLVRRCGLYSNRQKARLEVARGLLGMEVGKEPVQEQERCPRCKGKLEVVMNSRMRPLVFDHERLGFGVDPPEHWELSEAS